MKLIGTEIEFGHGINHSMVATVIIMIMLLSGGEL
jgi:hypothetical protein